MMKPILHVSVLTLLSSLALASLSWADTDVNPTPANESIKVFLLVGDDHVLEQGLANGRTDGRHDGFYPNAEKTEAELQKHVNAAVYAGDYSANTDYDQLEPIETAVVEIGYQRTRRIDPKIRGREDVPMQPFPQIAYQPGHTTVLRGFLSVKTAGLYELLPGEGDSAYNVTTVEGVEVYRRDVGDEQATLKPVELEPGKRYPFKTIFFKTPGHPFAVHLLNKPGTLTTAVFEHPDKYGHLIDEHGQWVTRDDVMLYDLHPIHNNTEAPARPLPVTALARRGPHQNEAVSVATMLGHRLGDAFDQPVLLVRFGTKHRTWFKFGSRDLSHDYRPPSSGGGNDLDGSFDVIHFNHGVWDAVYRDAGSKYFSGVNTTSVEDFEKNLRTLVGKMKQTGATLIWASVTPVWEGEPDKPNGDEDAYNRVAEKVMKEHGVIINDLNAETRRQGFPKTHNVHSVGNLAPKVTKVIQQALAERENKTKPLPRVLFIGDSITGLYWPQVRKNLDGQAVVFKNPGNAEDTWNGLERIDQWLDLNTYLLNGQEYLELVDGMSKLQGDELERVYPGYAGQDLELAGLIWFQGEEDSNWDSKAAGYEQHLANLIRDLRKDLGEPNLPVVIAALSGVGKLRTNQQKVFDAQMAVGDPQKYPEFEGNIISIDTRPMARPRGECPGGRDRFRGHAESYLEIGDAMGQAMLKLKQERSP